LIDKNKFTGGNSAYASSGINAFDPDDVAPTGDSFNTFYSDVAGTVLSLLNLPLATNPFHRDVVGSALGFHRCVLFRPGIGNHDVAEFKGNTCVRSNSIPLGWPLPHFSRLTANTPWWTLKAGTAVGMEGCGC
jgi:hypothetical protein